MAAISIVTALYNRLDLTQSFVRQLQPLLREKPLEVILVDDGSSDGTREFLATLQAPFRVILNEHNLGYAGSNNVGARSAGGDFLFFLNNDLELKPGWLEPMLAEVVKREVGMVGNVQLNAGTGLIDHAGIVFTPWGIPEHYGQNYLRLPRRRDCNFAAVTAACCTVRRQVFLDAGGFDEGYRNGMEDIDLCLRLREGGLQNRVVTRSVVGHHISSSPGRKNSDQANIRRFLDKWGHLTRELGWSDWPMHYLRRHMRHPWRLNGPKTWQALTMLAGIRRKRPVWMLERERQLRAPVDNSSCDEDDRKE